MGDNFQSEVNGTLNMFSAMMGCVQNQQDDMSSMLDLGFRRKTD